MAKLAIKETFKRDKAAYKMYTKLVKELWLLNPAYMYDPNSIIKGKVIIALVEVLEKIAEPRSQYFKLMDQFSLYRKGKVSFSKATCKEASKVMDPCKYSKCIISYNLYVYSNLYQ